VSGWTYFILTGSISTIWPLFGVANQLLATIALCIGSLYLLNSGRGRYLPVTLFPMIFVGVTTITAAIENITDNYLPLAQAPGSALTGYLDAALCAIMVACVLIILAAAGVRVFRGAAQR
jgi:carbon starvation protein